MTTESFFCDPDGNEVDEGQAEWKVERNLGDDGSVISETFFSITRGPASNREKVIMSNNPDEGSAASQNVQDPALKQGDSHAAGKIEPDDKPEKKYSDADVDAIFNKKWAKHQAALEKKYGDLEKLNERASKFDELSAKAAKLDKLEAEKLSKEEQLAREIESLKNAITEKEKAVLERERELQKRDLKEKSRAVLNQAIADKKLRLPNGKTVDALLDLVVISSDEEIESKIETLAGYFPPDKSVAGGTQTVEQKKPPANDAKTQIAELEKQYADPKATIADRDRLGKQILLLKLRANRTGV
jgi:hypothetical protein